MLFAQTYDVPGGKLAVGDERLVNDAVFLLPLSTDSDCWLNKCGSFVE